MLNLNNAPSQKKQKNSQRCEIFFPHWSIQRDRMLANTSQAPTNHKTHHFLFSRITDRGHDMDQVLTVMVISVLLGAVIALSFFTSYFSKRRSDVQSIAKAESESDPKTQQRPPQPKKSHSKAHSHSAADKVNSSLNSLFDFRESVGVKWKRKIRTSKRKCGILCLDVLRSVCFVLTFSFGF